MWQHELHSFKMGNPLPEKPYFGLIVLQLETNTINEDK